MTRTFCPNRLQIYKQFSEYQYVFCLFNKEFNNGALRIYIMRLLFFYDLPITYLIIKKKVFACKQKLSRIVIKFKSLLSDSNQRPRDYKSRALAN